MEKAVDRISWDRGIPVPYQIDSLNGLCKKGLFEKKNGFQTFFSDLSDLEYAGLFKNKYAANIEQ